MSKFTTLQADAATVAKACPHKSNGAYDYHYVALTHNGLGYELYLPLTLEASKADIKAAIHAELLLTEKKVAVPTDEMVPDALDIEGNTVGAL
jgi:hypothetical protein